MIERTYKFMGYTIQQWQFYPNGKRYFYPSFNGDAEFTDIRKCCKYIKNISKLNEEIKQTHGYSLHWLANLLQW